jgi:hypothetical protein
VPGGRIVALCLLVAVGIAITVRLVRHPPRTAAEAGLIIGGGLLAAILLMPTTRFGYLLYPVAFLAWAAPLRSARAGVRSPSSPPSGPEHSNHTAASGPPDDTALYRL